MKTLNTKKDVLVVLTYTVIGLAAVITGCSDNSFSSGTSAQQIVIPQGTSTPGPGACTLSATTTTLAGVTGGSTVVLNVTSQTQLDSYLGWTTYSPTNTAININLTQTGQFVHSGVTDYGYGGNIVIGFTDSPTGTAETYEDSFTSQLQGGPNTISSQAANDQYNLESTQYPGYPNGAFHGFYQGTTYCNGYPMQPGQLCNGQIFGGAVIVVLNSNSTDACGNPTAGGSVWYKNFVGTGPIDGPIAGTSCWFISAGPYQCREWLSGSGVATLIDLLPNGSGGYQELGTFSGVNLSGAFNGTWQVL